MKKCLVLICLLALALALPLILLADQGIYTIEGGGGANSLSSWQMIKALQEADVTTHNPTITPQIADYLIIRTNDTYNGSSTVYLANPSQAPAEGDILIWKYKNNDTVNNHSVAFGSGFMAGVNQSLPSSVAPQTEIWVKFEYTGFNQNKWVYLPSY